MGNNYGYCRVSEIMRLGENKTYEYLKTAHFKVKETETS